MKIHLQEYITACGHSPYQRWFNGLNAIAATKVATAMARVELGNTSRVKWFRGIGEYVIDWGPGNRVYLAKDGDELIILFGGSSKRQQQKAIEQAIALHDEYKVRKGPRQLTKRGGE